MESELVWCNHDYHWTKQRLLGPLPAQVANNTTTGRKCDNFSFIPVHCFLP